MKTITNFFTTLLFSCFLLFMLNSCSQSPPPVDQAAVKNAILEVDKAFVNAYNSGDAAGVAAQYTSDGTIMPPNGTIVQGPDAIEGFWKTVMGMGIAKVDLQTTEVRAGEDFAIEVGKALLFTADGTQADVSKFMVWWKKEDGQWKLHRDIWNSDLPPPPPPSEAGEEM